VAERLLGYDPPDVTQRRSRFYGAVEVANCKLPEGLDSYVFHPIGGHEPRIAAPGQDRVRPFG
jgi:hypothetical protein